MSFYFLILFFGFLNFKCSKSQTVSIFSVFLEDSTQKDAKKWFFLVSSLEYPKELLSLNILTTNKQIRNFFDKNLKNVYSHFNVIERKITNFNNKVKKEDLRISLLSRYQNMLVYETLKKEKFLLWIDPKIKKLRPKLLTDLLVHKKDLIVPKMVGFDWNEKMKFECQFDGKTCHSLVTDISSSNVILMKSFLFRYGVIFPVFPIIGSLFETLGGADGLGKKGLCYIAQQINSSCHMALDKQ